MLRMIGAFALVLALAFTAAWLADQPGTVTVRISGYEVATSLLVAGLALILFAGLVVLVWLTYHWVVDAPGAVGAWLRGRKRRRGMDALSRGMIAAGAGDAVAAAREAAVARQELGDVPLSLLLRAQTAQLQGDEPAARKIFETMLARTDTEALGLRGLFMLARKTGDAEAARELAGRAAARGPAIPWASLALFELRSSEGNWSGALETLEDRRRNKLLERPEANRLAAVLRTARAEGALESNPAAALDDALEAHRLAPELVPAAAIAARLLAEDGESGRAARIIERTWRVNPHPDLALVYAHVRPGDSPRQRLARVESLAARTAGHIEGAVAVARAGLEARAFDEARAALAPHLDGAPSQRVCAMMAEIENAGSGDSGRVREWLARAVNAQRDPVWTADGFVSPHWRPVSPVTGRLDAFEWKVPVEGALPAAASGALIDGPRIVEIEAEPVAATAPDDRAKADGLGEAPASGGVRRARPAAAETDTGKTDPDEDAGALPGQPDDPGVTSKEAAPDLGPGDVAPARDKVESR